MQGGKNRNREQSIASNVSAKLRWRLKIFLDEKIEEMLLKFARAVNRAWKATLHAGHIGVGGAI